MPQVKNLNHGETYKRLPEPKSGQARWALELAYVCENSHPTPHHGSCVQHAGFHCLWSVTTPPDAFPLHAPLKGHKCLLLKIILKKTKKKKQKIATNERGGKSTKV